MAHQLVGLKLSHLSYSAVKKRRAGDQVRFNSCVGFPIKLKRCGKEISVVWIFFFKFKAMAPEIHHHSFHSMLLKILQPVCRGMLSRY